jgi:fatty acid-binding protein DegV
MVKQGRISKVTGLAAKLMNLKPVVGIDQSGKGEITKKAFSLNGNIRQIIKLITRSEISQYVIVHADAEDRAMKLAGKIKKETGLDPLYITSISPVVAMNAGLGAVAVALTYKEEVK